VGGPGSEERQLISWRAAELTRVASRATREQSALADRVSHVCKSAAVWWDGRRALPLKRRWRRARPVPGRGPFESVERLRYQGGEVATQAPVNPKGTFYAA
jgi:hypothetical protein